MDGQDDYAETDPRRDRDSPLFMPALVAAVIAITGLVGLSVIALYAYVFGVPE
jgi:hypothetical protein